jgi:hypothetical protein
MYAIGIVLIYKPMNADVTPDQLLRKPKKCGEKEGKGRDLLAVTANALIGYLACWECT